METSPPKNGEHPPRIETPQEWRTPKKLFGGGTYGQRAGGTHPTGMHSCFLNVYYHCTLVFIRINVINRTDSPEPLF